MLRKLFTGASLALVLAAPAHAQETHVLLMPGVTYSRDVEFTTHGPVAMHVITAPRPGGLFALKPVLSNGSIVGRETVTAMERKLSPTATVVGVNGDLFNWADGHPSGVLMRSGVLDSPPSADRSSIGVSGDGALHVDRIAYSGLWRGNGQRRALRLNQPPGTNGVTLYTPSWGAATPAGQSVVEAVLPHLPPAAPNTDLADVVAQIGATTGGTPIPPGGAVIAARGTGAAKLAAEAPLGTTIVVRLTLSPSWAGITDAIGGGPILVKNGKPVFRANEVFSIEQLGPRNPRTAVGQLPDGRILLLAVDGRQPGYSVGVTNFELALALARLGCVTGSALDAGGSTTMAFEGSLLNRPSDPGGERAVAEALLVLYYGVYAPPPSAAVVSPNGDGADDQETLAYKLVRPATVTATLTGPDGVARPVYTGQRQPGLYRFAWKGVTQAGAPEPEGRWRFAVTAADDQGQSSTTERLFSLNGTLSSLQLTPNVVVRKRSSNLRASFVLVHPAQVSVTVERLSGTVVRTVFQRSPLEGPVSTGWNGRDAAGLRAFPGRYRLRVRATNELGSVDLSGVFTLSRG